VKNKVKGAFIFLATMTVVFFACNSSKNNENSPANVNGSGTPVIAADAVSFNYGQVEEGTRLEHVFKIQNKGDGILVIKKATGS
jgi:hypothetical protein